MASNSREARRKKILERGSDRLAFITGQINGVPSPPPSDSTSLSQSTHLRSDDSVPDTIPPRDQILTAQEFGSTSQQGNITDAATLDKTDHIIHQNRAESLQPRKYTETLAEASASDPGGTTIQSSPTTSSAQTPSVVDLGASQAFTPLVSFANSITPKHIGAAIDASEYARLFSALVIALLVILSHLGFSSLGSIVSFRPVFLLVLTDATIVLGMVLLSHRGDPSSASRREYSVVNGQGIADQVGNALETVMIVKKIMDAVLMDFSLYAEMMSILDVPKKTLNDTVHPMIYHLMQYNNKMDDKVRALFFCQDSSNLIDPPKEHKSLTNDERKAKSDEDDPSMRLLMEDEPEKKYQKKDLGPDSMVHAASRADPSIKKSDQAPPKEHEDEDEG